MKKIKTLFKIDPITHLLTEEVVAGSEWVINGEGIATEKFNGTACMVRDGKLYKRYDRKANKPAPSGWEACESEPDKKSGHWPGWLAVSDTDPQDQWHREAFKVSSSSVIPLFDGTHELVGPKIQGNPYKLDEHKLWQHGSCQYVNSNIIISIPRDFEGIKEYFANFIGYIEGVVWHRRNGDMVKIRAKDFKKE